MYKPQIGIGDKRLLTPDTRATRLHSLNTEVNVDRRKVAGRTLEGLYEVWQKWRAPETKNYDPAARALAATFIAQNLRPILQQQDTDPAAVAFVTFLGDTLTTKEFAISQQVHRLAKVITSLTTSHAHCESPIDLIDERTEVFYENETNAVINGIFETLGPEGDFDNCKVTREMYEDSYGIRRSASFASATRPYDLLHDVHEINPRIRRHVLALQMTPLA